MIQQYLNLQFIKTTEDENFNKLKSASDDVVKLLNADKTKISSYTLAALDPLIKADDPNILEVQNVIIEHWRTFIANSKDTAVTIIRAVMLESLKTIASEKSGAYIIWFAGRNVIKRYKLGREKDLLTTFLLSIGNEIQSEVLESWSFSPDQVIEIPEIESALIKQADMDAQIKAATLLKDWGGENTASQATNDTTWGSFFSTRLSKGISDLINKAFKKQSADFKLNQQAFFLRNSLMQMRTQLLWWKEASYSSSINDNYKNLKDGPLQVVLAWDYSQFVPTKYPTSVDYFLIETQNSLSPSKDKKNKISEILKIIEQNNALVKAALSDYTGPQGRISLLNFVKGMAHSKFQSKQFESMVGIDEATELSFAEFIVWLFHDINSVKLTNSK